MSKTKALPRLLIYQEYASEMMANYLSNYGFDIITSTDDDISEKLYAGNYDLAILGHFRAALPGDLRLVKGLRKSNSRIPIILVSNMQEYEYIIEAFDAGVDDYVIIPYNIEELIRRIKAVLRRCGIKTRAIEYAYKIGSFTFDTQAKVLSMNGIDIHLNTRENMILSLLCAYKNEVLPSEIVMQQIWKNKENTYHNRRSMHVYITSLRNYLKMDNSVCIDSIKGIGYSLVDLS